MYLLLTFFQLIFYSIITNISHVIYSECLFTALHNDGVSKTHWII